MTLRKITYLMISWGSNPKIMESSEVIHCSGNIILKLNKSEKLAALQISKDCESFVYFDFGQFDVTKQ